MHNGRDSMLTKDIEKDRQTLEALSPEALLAWAAQRFKGERVYFNFDRKFYEEYGMSPPFPELKE